MTPAPPDVWLDGEFMTAAEATVPLLSHGLHYGTAVFEGARVYETPRGSALFRYQDHIDRLFRSAGLYSLKVPYSKAEVHEATRELVLRSGLSACYVRPIVFPGEGTLTISPLDTRVRVGIAVWEWGAYLGEAGKRDGIRAKVSSWTRVGGDAVIPFAKAAGHYVGAALAKLESQRAGYEEGILLDQRGMVSEGTGENIFVVVDGTLATPGLASSILDGITRRSVLEIARDVGVEAVERDITRQELYLADEVFVTGTAAELTPVREVDDHPIGDGRPGPITRCLQMELDDALHGRSERYAHWNEPVASEDLGAAATSGSA